MKILCTADWHIGKKLEMFSRLEEQKTILDHIVTISEQENSDAVIIAGDCFDTQSPSPEMTKLFVSTLARLSRGGECPVLVIAGNHDNPLFLSASEAFASQVGVLILGYPNQTPSLEQTHSAWKVTYSNQGVVELFFKKSKKTIRFLMSPYANAQRLKKDLGIDDPDKKAWEILCSEWGKNISHDSDVKNILITHSYLLPEKKDTLIQDELPKEDSGERSIMGTIGGISLIHLPQGIDYVIAGHIHKPQSLYSPHTKAFYTGSPLIYSLSESGQEKSVLILDLGKKDKEYLIPLPKMRDVKEIHFDDFTTIGAILEQEKENYLILIWEGDRYFTSEEHQYLRNTHLYLIRVEAHPKIKHIQDNTQAEKIQEQSTKDLFSEYFCSKHHNQLPPEDLLTLFEECLQEESSVLILEKKRGFLPKSLKIKGIYSYKEEVTIDFTLLEEKGFFGIFGNTGSGKSALIEAMIIAIFYKVERFGTFGASGKGNFSNSYGIMNLESNELLIEFIFEIIGTNGIEEYCCRIHGTRDKKKHTLVTIKREVFLKDQEEWIPSDTVAGEELLGISYDDFRKTIVLQQRDFLGFISAAPKENTETLMRLFQLERFDLYHIVDRLEKKESAGFYTLKSKLEQYESYTEENLSQIIKEKEQMQETLVEVESGLEKQRSLVNQLTKQQEQQNHALVVQEKFQELSQQEEVFQQAQKRLAVNPIILWDQKIYTHQETQKNLEEQYRQLQFKQQEETKSLERIHIEGQESSSHTETLKQNLEQKQQEWEQAISHNISEQVLILENKKKEYQNILKASQELKEQSILLEQHIAQKEECYQKWQTLQQEEDKMRDFLGLDLALKHLEKDCPCPLCGALDHPHPYDKQADSVFDELNSQREQAQHQYLKIQQEEESLNNNNKILNTYHLQLQDILGEYKEEKHLNHAYQGLLAQKTNQEQQSEELKKETSVLQSQYNQADQQTKLLREQYYQKNRVNDQLESELIYKDKELQKINQELLAWQQERKEYKDSNQITEEQYLSMAQYPQKAEKEINEFFREFLMLSGQIQSINTLIQNPNIDSEELEKEIKNNQEILHTLNQEHSQQLQLIGSLIGEIKTTSESIIQKKQFQEEYDKKLIRKNNMEFLKKLFKSSGFVHFIGQKYLSQLCYTANQRFLRFTQNQFELSAPEELDDKKGRIVVMDRLAGGNKRDILTLSGGQSFQAALSLALALADTSGAGHRFFFIDEGFGSLDNDSLYLILDSLRELAEIENRVVGVISHVQIMQEEIPACLYVHLDKIKGTQIELIL